LSESGEDQKLLAAIECAANPTRHKILEILSEKPGLGTKALANEMGVTRQHIAYHIGELRKADLIKDISAGTIVIYHVTQSGRTALQRIHLTPHPEEKDLAHEASVPTPPRPTQEPQEHKRRASSTRLLGLMPALAGLTLLLCSIFWAIARGQPSYILGGVMIFLLMAYLSKKVIGWLPQQ